MYKDFKRLCNYASKFRHYLKDFYKTIIASPEVKKGCFMGGRLSIVDGEIDYIVAQSFNEEYINIMADILNRAGVYNSRVKWYM